MTFKAMQIAYNTQAESAAIQTALFALGYKWYEGQTYVLEYAPQGYIRTGSDGEFCRGDEQFERMTDYVMVDGKFYIKGEEPRAKFKAGDMVKCIRATGTGRELEDGKVYTVEYVKLSCAGDMRVHLKDVIDMGNSGYFEDRFELYVEPAPVVVPEGNIKIRVRDAEQSEQVQKAFFAAGGKWNMNGVSVQHTEQPFLFFDDTFVPGVREIMYASAGSADFFEEDSSQEYAFFDGRFIKVIDEPVQVAVFDEVEPAVPVVRTQEEFRKSLVVAHSQRLQELLAHMLALAERGLVIPDVLDNEYDNLREELNAYYESN